jgi:formylglycine-generating enzyme required for sulfatase activity
MRLSWSMVATSFATAAAVVALGSVFSFQHIPFLQDGRSTGALAVAPLALERERTLKPGDSFNECHNCPEMIVVPTGGFWMGASALHTSEYNNAFPGRPVTFARQFAVGKFEIAFIEWDTCVADGGCNGYRPTTTFGLRDGREPVVNVSWHDAEQYVAWISKVTGKPYRLLSESEYEYAARAGTQTNYPWGFEIGTNNADCKGCGSQWDDKRPAPVGSFAPNSFGLYDMVGNVWEWVEDCYHPSYSLTLMNGSADVSYPCENRVIRGGSFIDAPVLLGDAIRGWRDAGEREDWLGFRIARTLLP